MWGVLVHIVDITAEYGGLAGIILLFWMIDRFLLVRDLRKLNDQMIAMVTSSTAAQVTAAAALRNLNDSIAQLCSRI